MVLFFFSQEQKCDIQSILKHNGHCFPNVIIWHSEKSKNPKLNSMWLPSLFLILAEATICSLQNLLWCRTPNPIWDLVSFKFGPFVSKYCCCLLNYSSENILSKGKCQNSVSAEFYFPRNNTLGATCLHLVMYLGRVI